MDHWKLQDAKARFSEVVDRALRDGPQIVTRHGANAVVIVAYEDYVRDEPQEDFKAFLTSVPLSELDIERQKHLPRKTIL
jgi:antitoxin Phd